MTFILSTNLGEVSAILGTVFIGMKEPLAAIHVLWVNLIVESLLAIPFSSSKNDDDVIKNKPRHKDESIFKNILSRILFTALCVGMTVFISYYFMMKSTNNHKLASTVAFIIMSNAPVLYALSINSTKSILSKDFYENKVLNIAALLALIFNIILVTVPYVSQFFKLETMDFATYGKFFALALIPLALLETFKIIKFKK